MTLRCSPLALVALFVLFALVGSPAHAESITQAYYEAPVDRYGHFALGRPHEYARVTATTDAGRTWAFELPAHEVFEDLAPRIVRLSQIEADQLLTIVSSRERGSRLMLLGLAGGGLAPIAESAAIGWPNRWLNPVGVVDLDGDGQAEIAAVITPHIGGVLKVYRRQGSQLVEIAALGGFSNHVYGSSQLALSAPISIAGQTHLLVPDTNRLALRMVALKNGGLVETGRCPLSSRVTGALQQSAPDRVSIGLRSGRQWIDPLECLKP